ncbi:helix-turn-helix domain-containing protein [Cereibacter azotoformans]|uniref:ArsR/SmtB family transcription factor n=1 Tax=Cereibacter azotoformans TaxID=43057 RepID=UPI0002F5AB53|nr:helix-turn-helix domain-containing protein [Cereibacter azotoformans]ULB11778.1 helix-turn-helix domain-containing protein [Cereibacter azotoformans]
MDQVGPAQSTVSQHLRILKTSGLVHGTIDHPRICHALDPTALAPLRALLDAIAARHADGDAPCCYTPQGCVPRGTAPWPHVFATCGRPIHAHAGATACRWNVPGQATNT